MRTSTVFKLGKTFAAEVPNMVSFTEIDQAQELPFQGDLSPPDVCLSWRGVGILSSMFPDS